MADTITDVDLEKNFTFRMDQAMRDKIDRVAKVEDRSAGSAARVLIAEALKAREEKEQSK
jgi:predicted transcriptional regulator